MLDSAIDFLHAGEPRSGSLINVDCGIRYQGEGGILGQVEFDFRTAADDDGDILALTEDSVNWILNLCGWMLLHVMTGKKVIPGAEFRTFARLC